MPGYDTYPGGEGGGTSDHTALTNRDAADAHEQYAAVVGPLEIRDGDDDVRARVLLTESGGVFGVTIETLAVGGLTAVGTINVDSDGYIAISTGGGLTALAINPAGDLSINSPGAYVSLTAAGEAEITVGSTGFEASDANGMKLKGSKLGFYGGTAITKPEIPANPTPQDIADTLVALGLITQAV